MHSLIYRIRVFFYRRPVLFVRYDSKQGEPVLFLHGIATDGSCWDDCKQNLKGAGYRVIVVDLLGFGKSPKPNESSYSLKEHAKSVEKTIKKLKIRQTITIVGHSMGSLIAIDIANRKKLAVKELFLCSPPIYLPKDLQKVEEDYSKTSRSKNNAYFKIYKLIANRPNVTLRAAKLASAGVSGFTLNKDTWEPFKKSLVHSIIDQNSLEEIKKIKINVNIIYGIFDLLIIPKNYQLIAKKMPNVTLKKARAGHALNQSYSKFIAKQLRSSLTDKP